MFSKFIKLGCLAVSIGMIFSPSIVQGSSDKDRINTFSYITAKTENEKEKIQAAYRGSIIDLSSAKTVASNEFLDQTKLEKKADLGNSDAQFRLGEMLYQNGKKKDAIVWLKKAEKQDNLLAKARLFKINCEKNQQRESLNNPYLSILEDNSSSDDLNLIILGDFYTIGCGVHKDYKKALSYFKKAEKYDSGYVSLSIASILTDGGFGVDKDAKQSIVYLQKSAEQGNAVAQNYLAYFYQSGEVVSKDISKAEYWYKKSAEQGNPLAQLFLAHLYADGKEISKDVSKAAYWYQKSAEQGNPLAQSNLAHLYEIWVFFILKVKAFKKI